MKRFHAIHCSPSPYRLHLFKELYRQLDAKGIDFHVHFMSDMTWGGDERVSGNGRPRAWANPRIDFPHTYWRDFGPKAHYFNPGMIWHVRKLNPDWLFIGSLYDTFTGMLSSRLCTAKVKCAWAEGNTKTPGRITGFLGWFKRFLLSEFQFVAVPGQDGASYIQLLQKNCRKQMPKPIFLPNLVDESRFKPREQWEQSRIDEIRSRYLRHASDKLCLIPARLEPAKGLLELIAKLTPNLIKGWRIVIMGQGGLKDEIDRSLRDKGLTENIVMLSYVPYDEMPVHYAAADLFMLPSIRDPNPLSVVEALHSGLPVAVSSQTGNVEEAVTDGKNGWRLPVLEERQYAEVLPRIFGASADELRDKGKWSKTNNASFWDTRLSISKFLDELGVE